MIEQPDFCTEENVAYIMKQVLQAVGHCHEKGIIHGFLNPNHILVNPAKKEAVIIDFK
jgi:serine/threonine protein kinase